MNTFIKIIEIWTPTADRRKLQLADGIFNGNNEFEGVTRKKNFGYNEGLPGKAWSAAFPQIITDLENSIFVRKQGALDANLSSGIAFPIFSGEFLLAVVVFLCGDKQFDAGAIELWGNVESVPNALSLVDGYYGSLEILQMMSSHKIFKKGEGLPGTVWDYNLPILIDDPRNSAIFLRRSNAEIDGISAAFGLPYRYNENELVLTFLSSMDTPIARRFEIWVPERNHSYLFFHSGKCEFDEDLSNIYKDKKIDCGSGLIGQTWRSGCPQIGRDMGKEFPESYEYSKVFTSAFTLPIIDNGLLRSLVVLYF